MLVSPFTFYRGAAPVMAMDLAGTPGSGIVAQTCGDAHISNFGGFAAPDGKMGLRAKRLDETLPGVCGSGTSNAWRPAPASELVHRFGGELGKKGRIIFSKHFAKGRQKTSLRAVTKLTERLDGELRFRNVPPLLVPLREVLTEDHALDEDEYMREVLSEDVDSLDEERRYLFGSYRFVDMARKVVGVGSVGTRAAVFVLVGRDGKDPLVLQSKEAQASVLEPYQGGSEFENHGERVVRGERISHAAIDILLSWTRGMGLDGQEHDFYVRQLWDWKASMDLSTISESGLHAYTRACGWSTGSRPRPLRRSGRHGCLPGRRPGVRHGHRRLRQQVCRSERARPHPTGRCRRGRRSCR
jgi:hypothetical protein